MKILIDNGHGSDTKGKCSPDRRLLEYAYTREIAARIVAELKLKGYDAMLLTPEMTDVSLAERCRRANAVSRQGEQCILVSIHCNAAGCGEWMSARGWECYTTKGKTKSDLLAECLYSAAKGFGLKLRTDYSDGDSDKEANFYILQHTACPAVLTENLFQDNKEDVAFLLSAEGRNAIVNLHVSGIIDYLKQQPQ